MTLCFNYLSDPAEALAVKVIAMSVLAKLAPFYPDIITELQLIIEDQFPQQSAGFKSRAKKVMKILNKVIEKGIRTS